MLICAGETNLTIRGMLFMLLIVKTSRLHNHMVECNDDNKYVTFLLFCWFSSQAPPLHLARPASTLLVGYSLVRYATLLALHQQIWFCLLNFEGWATKQDTLSAGIRRHYDVNLTSLDVT